MKAKIGKRHESEKNRVVLENFVPLKTPFVLMVDPSSACNQKCIFCPTGNHDIIKNTGRYQGIMHYDLFKKIIDETSDFDSPIKTLRLYNQGEPLLNPNLPEMIEYAKNSLNILRIDITTNGVLLNPELNKKLIEAGIDQINISVNGIDAEQFFKFTRTKIDFEKYVKNIENLYRNKGNCEIYIKAIKQNLTPKEETKFYELFGDFSDRIFLENISPVWPEFYFDNTGAKIEIGQYGQELLEKQVCPYIFYLMVINSDGTVSTCNQDWKRKLVVGDTVTQNLKDIWLGDNINLYRMIHLDGNRRKIEICANCDAVSYCTLDNIDAASSEIKYRLINKIYK